MELIEIVDSMGNFTGEIIDRALAHEKNLLHNEICCFILNNNRQVLLQKELIRANGAYVQVMFQLMRVWKRLH